MNEELLLKILQSDISKEVKDKIASYWLLPPEKGSVNAPILKSDIRVGAIRRPTKEQLDLRANPKKKEEQEAMEETLEEVTKEK